MFHVSEEGDIECFEPRWSETVGQSVVWAVDARHLHNYLLPRECPRVTYYAGPRTLKADIEEFLGNSRAVVAIESRWFEQVRSCRLFCYHLPAATFECFDECAGYFVSKQSVEPERVEVLDDLILEILSRGVELRFAPNLWPLRDAVVTSTLQFSLIRMRNAQTQKGTTGF